MPEQFIQTEAHIFNGNYIIGVKYVYYQFNREIKQYVPYKEEDIIFNDLCKFIL